MKQITDKIYQISLGAVNAFVIDDDGLTLVDTGIPGSLDKIALSLTAQGKKLSDIKRIILTHCHPDHAGSAAAIVSKINVPVLAHQLDADLIEKGIGHRAGETLSPGVMNWLLYYLFIKKAPRDIMPVHINQRLNDNDVIDIAGGIQVIHTPGHTAGHISLLVRSEGVLIAGDICGHLLGLSYSPLYEDRVAGHNSILKAAGFDFDKAVFGHGEALEKGANKALNNRFAITGRAAAVTKS